MPKVTAQWRDILEVEESMTAPDTKFHFSPRANRAHEIKWREWGEDAFGEAKETGKAAELRQRRQTAMSGERGQLSESIFDDILRSVIENYDPLYGGFGEAPKFPHTEAIDLLLYAYRKKRDPDLLHMARKTLEFMSRGDVFDREWGGFFRYATRGDGGEPHY